MIVPLSDLVNTLKQYTGRIVILVHDQRGVDYAVGATQPQATGGGSPFSIHMAPDEVPKGYALVRGTER
jgi:hypothetical protein